jgi:hypothetical protein
MRERAQGLFKQLQERVKTTMQVVADIAESVGVPPAVTSLIARQDEQWTPPTSQSQPPPAAPQPSAPKEAAGEQTATTKAAEPPGEPEAAEQTAEPAVEVLEVVEAEAAEPAEESIEAADVEQAAESAAAASEKAAKTKTTSKSTNGTSVKTRRTSAQKRKATKKRVIEGNKAKSVGVRPLQVDDAINGSTYLARIVWSLGVANVEGLGPLRPADIARMVMARSPVSLEPPNVARYIRRSKPTCIVVAHTEGSSNYYKLNAAGKRLFEEHFGAN